MSALVLYVTDDCSLCDQALELMAAAGAPDFQSVFIDDVPALQTTYGWRVPVVHDGHRGRELDWPFDVAALRAFLQPG
ncbi:glutaredoxin family protein [Dokdonella koreensis]|nr:glutaredoxin family protein [Dokdonella koreensis]